MRLVIAQINPTIGDLDGNVAQILDAYKKAQINKADLVVTSELAITGYPPRDLLDRPRFLRDAIAALSFVVNNVKDIPLIIGAIVSNTNDPLVLNDRIANGAVVIANGKIIACHRKMLLPSYDVFDETRYFVAGEISTIVEIGGKKIGLSVCEDAWNDKEYWQKPRYARDPLTEQIAAGANLLINISASPYDRQKPAKRLTMLQSIARRHKVPFVYVNQVGGNDSLIFDGRSFAIDAFGEVALMAPAFRSALVTAEIQNDKMIGDISPAPSCWEADVCAALELGVKDYTQKCGFNSAVLGLSGGIDSALTAAIATKALGPDRVIGISMPSRYSSQGSIADARDLAQRLGIRFDVVSIESIFKSYLEALAEPFKGYAADVTEENLQARIRGAILMAYSNKLGALLLTTGNKSELAVGYCTLYGDMCGGLALISDLYKTQVYAVAKYINTSATPALIPENSIIKPPSAELRPDQTDQDSLPPYEQLDEILAGYIEGALCRTALISRGLDSDLVHRVTRLVDTSEYKRRQMPPGLRISRKAFGEGRRIPIAQKYSYSR
ncbi:MAG: NAD+ synthase [Deltaproteobacteria bacterium]|nr:NAD+ synthase [Deltaproteobacteria bacterium]